ncbi:MAG: HAD-IA family hydrolase, partial [Firmicutes bacterium]|nr:HAD-IA family hydrolase [Bacillota bacterium]
AGSLHDEYWNTIPGSEYFDGKVVSAFEKLVKPQPEIYRVLLDRFGLVPEECLFVDDREINLAGAAICGMQSMAFRTAEDFLRQLKERGIELPE